MTVTYQSAIHSASKRLSASSYSATAHRDAELLLLHVTGLTRAALLTHPEGILTPGQHAAYQNAIIRRERAEPVQYITGTQEFFGRPFRVTPAVLIPRPETEHLVEAALALASPAKPLRIADVGTGSGILAITLALHLTHATIVATDISPAALSVARSNAEQHNVVNRIQFLEADLLGNAEPASYDLIVSNPPYIPESEVLETQVAAYEPPVALYAGSDGLTIYRRLIRVAARALAPGGHLLLEIGHGQSHAIAALLQQAALREVHFENDLQGIPRVAVATAELG